MSAIKEFKQSKEYQNFTEAKKEAFEKAAINLAQKKSPRVIDLKVLTENDIKSIKGKLKNID